MTEVSNHLRRLADRLFPESEEREQFLDSLCHPMAYDRAVLWLKERPTNLPFSRNPPFSWQPEFVDRAPARQRPGQDPLHEQGFYYCLDFSSVFAAMVLSPLPTELPLLIDMCAAPGGKAIFAARMLSPGRLICNEVIKKRTGVLKANLQRCGVRAEVISRDSQVMAAQDWQADLVIVDAPCSGQSLIARGKRSPGCFHPATINMNANRQKRILANSAGCVAPGGWLAYMTCTYAQKENEDVARWLLKRFPQFRLIAVERLSKHQSPFIDEPCYRLWPQQRMGAGAFGALFQAEK